MNNEQLREKLYSRINAEFAQFERELLEASPQDILDKSYPLNVPNRILVTFPQSTMKRITKSIITVVPIFPRYLPHLQKRERTLK